MKKIIIIVVALLVLGGGAFAGWKFFLSGDKGAPSAEHEKEGAGPVYLDMEPFIIPVIREDRVVKYLSLSVKLELAGPGAEAKVKEMMPYVRDAFLTRLHIALSRGDTGLNADTARLKHQLLAEAERVLGPDQVHDVLIGQAVEKSNPP